METDIKRIVKKKKPTGDEVGKTLLYMLASDTMNSSNRDYKPTITQAKFDEMVYSFSKEEDYIEYAFYKELYEVILSAKLFVEGLEQQTIKGLIQIQHMIQRDNSAEREKTAKEKLPVIMTQKQYQEYLAGEGDFINPAYETVQRIKVGGIAIIQGENAPNVDEEGTYKEPNTYIAQEITLDRMAQDVEYQKRVEVLYNNVVLSSLVFFAGYNSLLDILAEVSGVEELKEIKRAEKSFTNYLVMINETIDSLEENVYGDEAEKQRKRKILHDIFPKMPLEIGPIPEKAKAQVKKEIQKIKAEGSGIHNLQEFNHFVEKLTKGG